MSRGKTIALRHQKEKEWVAKYDRSLKNHIPKNGLSLGQILVSVLDRAYEFDEAPIRHLESFKAPKTKDEGKLRLMVAQHLYGKFPAPQVLKRIWYYDKNSITTNRFGQDTSQRLTDSELIIRTNMFLCVAMGQSLHRKMMSQLFTKKETHAFLVGSSDLPFEEALAFAVAGSYTDNYGIKNRIAKSSIRRMFESFSKLTVDKVAFSKDFIRFCITNEIGIEEINDIYDFLTSRQQRNEAFSFKGRTLSSMRKLVEDWHRALNRERRLGGKVWEGAPIADFTSVVTSGGKDKVWTITQINDSKALAAEGTALHHCVYSYQSGCVGGRLSIWSLKCDGERKVTIELNHNTENIVQARGYANRSAHRHEMDVIKEWAGENRLGIAVYAHY